MIKTLRKYQMAGFSLVELMVVVAIIGILASVAIPNYNRFQRKARAAEGKTVLTGIYNAEKSFLAEWEGYTSDLTAAGYSADGNLRTQAQTAGADVIPAQYPIMAPQANINRGMITQVLALCGTMWAQCMQHPAVAAAPAVGPGFVVNNPAPPALPNFIITSGTDVGSSAPEQWSVNEAKTFTQLMDGVNL